MAGTHLRIWVNKTKIFAPFILLEGVSFTYYPTAFTWAQVTKKDFSSPPDEFCIGKYSVIYTVLTHLSPCIKGVGPCQMGRWI